MGDTIGERLARWLRTGVQDEHAAHVLLRVGVVLVVAALVVAAL